MAPDPLDNARKRVGWAKQQLDVFDECCKGFLSRQPYETTTAFASNGFEKVFKVVIKEPPPLALALLTGDILHNARSALDNAVYGLAIRHTPSLSSAERGRLQFPLVGDVSGFMEQKRRGRLFGVPGKHRTAIHRFQPYPGRTWPNNWLGLLAELNNIDKHRFVHVVGASVQYALLSGIPEGHQAVPHWAHVPFLKESGAEIVRFTFDPPKADVDMEFVPEWIVAIEARQIPSGIIDPARATLGMIVEGVDHVLEELAKLA